MAKATAGAAYRELKRVGNYIMPTLNAAADSIAANARHQKALNAAEKARSDKRLDEALGDISVDTEALQAKATGFTSRDDIARDFAYTATERSQMYAEKAREAALNGDWVAMNNYKGKMNKIKGDFKNTVNDEAILKETMDTYRKAWQEGKVDDDDWLDFAESMEKFNYEVSLDDNDNKVIKAIVLDDDGQPELDDSGNPKYIVKKWSDVVNQHDRPYEVVQLEDKQGKKGLIGDMLATMGKRKYDEVSGDYITTKQTWDDEAEKQFKAKIRGIQSSDRMMHSILKQASGGTISKKKGFNDTDKELVEDFLRFQVKGGYDTEELEKVRSRTPSEIGASEAANRDARKKDDKEEVDPLSQLNYDADQFTKGDYTGLLGRHETDLGDAINIREVIPAPNANYVIAVTEGGDRLEVPKTKRGFLEFKIRNKPEYKGLTPEKVMSVKPVQYRTGTIGGADISNIANDMFNAEGKPKYDDERFLKRLNEAYGITGKDEFTWSGNSLLINGKKVSTKTKEAFKKDLNAALSKPTAAELIEKYRPK